MSSLFHGKGFTFAQADGTIFKVKGWGNQFHSVFETQDGHTILHNPKTGNYEIAVMDETGLNLLCSGIRADQYAASDIEGIPAGLREDPQITREIIAEKKTAICSHSVREAESKATKKQPYQKPMSLNGDIRGLCILVDFSDCEQNLDISRKEVQAFCNQKGYSGFGNHGSVYEYFHDNSGGAGKMRFTNMVTAYHRADHPRSFYEKLSGSGDVEYQGARILVTELITKLISGGFDFSEFTFNKYGELAALSICYAGDLPLGKVSGLWPHQGFLTTPLAAGNSGNISAYQVTHIGEQLSLGTFCHEIGHVLCDFPDLYDYGNQSYGAGVFCGMAYGATDMEDGLKREKTPGQFSAYIKYLADWHDTIYDLRDYESVTLEYGANNVAIYKNSSNESEYFLVEYRKNEGWDEHLPGSGLIIWHVDETGDNQYEMRLPEFHYELSLEQADGAFGLEENTDFGDANDIYMESKTISFPPTPGSQNYWWNGDPSGISVKIIEQKSHFITFEVSIDTQNTASPFA